MKDNNILGLGGVDEGGGSIDYNLDGVTLGSITLDVSGNDNPLKDLLDYEMKDTTEIIFRYPDGRKVKFIRDSKEDN